MDRRRPRRTSGPLAILLAVVFLVLLGPAAHAKAPAAAPGTGAAGPAAAAASAALATTVANAGSADLTDVADSGPPTDSAGTAGPGLALAQTPPSAEDVADEAVRALPPRVAHAPAGEPPTVVLPWASPPDPWYVLAAGGPPGCPAPDRVAEPLTRTAPRADRAPPAPAGISPVL